MDAVLADTPIAYWRLDESAGMIARDSSGHGNDGTYIGGVHPGTAGAIANDPDTAATFDGATGYMDGGNRFAFAQFSDTSGVFEATLFSEVLSASRELLDQGVPVLIAVDGRLDGDQVRLMAQSIEPLDKAAAGVGASLRIYLNDAGPVELLKTLLQREAKGKGRIWLVAMTGEREVEIALRGGFGCSPQLRQAILEYVDAHNDKRKPFRWTKTADEILDKMRRFGLRTQQVHAQ